MRKIDEALSELKLTWNIIQISERIVEGLLIFSLSLVLAIFIGVNWIYSLVPLIMYTLYRIYQYFRGNLFVSVEEKAPLLKEKLRTSVEHLDSNSVVVKELHDDVAEEIKKVKSSFLVDYKMLSYKLFGMVFLSFLVVIISVSNVNLGGIEGITGNLNKIKFVNDEKMEIPEIAIASQEGNLDIYGEASVAELGLQKQELEINAIDSEIDLNKIGGVERKNFAPQTVPKEIYTTYDVSYNERIPKENQKIVKSYFEKITK